MLADRGIIDVLNEKSYLLDEADIADDGITITDITNASTVNNLEVIPVEKGGPCPGIYLPMYLESSWMTCMCIALSSCFRRIEDQAKAPWCLEQNDMCVGRPLIKADFYTTGHNITLRCIRR